MTSLPSPATDIKPVPIEEEMKRSYLDYAMSVIVSRALPDVRDGLKPVHRRILFAMKEAGNEYNKPYRKSARVVGDVMGKYHPHGNAPIYEAMVRLTQDFNLRLPLIDGQGNFGSMDGDPAAAERYTEARLSRAAHELLEDIDRDTVDFQSNYDDTLEEPKVLPARFPNLLVNGTSGIAVGMATSVPTHNLGEIIEACCELIKNPELSLTELMQIVPGPDFPTGGIIMGRHGIYEAFRTGRGTITVRGKTHVETVRNEREAIIIDEVPYQVNKARMIERIAELVKEKIIEGISDIRDESDRDGMRIVIELKRDAVTDVVLNQLYRYSSLQTGVSFNMLALVHGRPEQLSLKQILLAFLDFREEVILRRTRYELGKAREKAHILLGFAIAVANIDPIIALIRAASDRHVAKIELMAKGWNAETVAPLLTLVENTTFDNNIYRLTDAQATAILDLRLHRLTGLEREKINNDLQEVSKQIQEYLSILGSREQVLEILYQELVDIKNQFATPRKTEIEEGDSTVDIEDLIQREDMVITVSMGGYIKRVPLSTYRAQKRGGRGRSGMTMKQEDAVSDLFVANTHSQILFFSTLGKVYQMKAYRLPIGTPQARGRAMVNLLPLAPNETISTILVRPEEDPNQQEQFLMFATSLGNVRRNKIKDFTNIMANGKKAIRLDENEQLIAVKLCCETDDILLSTQNGICNRFNVTDIRIFAGRDSNGVRGIRLNGDDHVISMAVIAQGRLGSEERDSYLRQSFKARQALNQEELIDNEIEETEEENTYQIPQERFDALAQQEQFILTITEKGFGKRTSAYAYRTTNRGSQGFSNIAVNARNGGVVASFAVKNDDHIMLVTNQGRLIRCPIHDVRITRRSAQGVIIFRVDDDEKVVSVSCIPHDESIEDVEDIVMEEQALE